MSNSPLDHLLVGVDLGASYTKMIVCGGGGERPAQGRVATRGRPLEALSSLVGEVLGRTGLETPVRVTLTGSAAPHASRVLGLPAVNEVLATARGSRRLDPEAAAVIDLGAQLSKWIVLGRGHEGLVRDFATNGLCAAGSGAFLEQQAGRLRLDVAELGDLARSASRGASIAGRCSVFAKSDMIHLQQKGTPSEEIAYGLCLALARTFLSAVVRGGELASPLLLVGGGSSSGGIVRALREVLGEQIELRVPDRALYAGALGAALEGQGATLTLRGLLRRLETAERADGAADRKQTGSCLPVLTPPAGPPPAQSERPGAGGAIGGEAFLGIDVGSVSTNLVLVGQDGDLLDGVYLPTRGQPVAALAEGLGRLAAGLGRRVEIVGVGSTGSGRHLAAELLGADTVRNEITAQLTSAAHFVPGVDTIFEIGGQDSKFIAVHDGRLADFEMNKICAAGTGSFLEEQAERLGISVYGEFSERAFASTRPVDLGTRCTVFMDSELVQAVERGVSTDDLCAGLAFSVCRNYLEKVVAGRRIGRRVVFQGGTASNRAVVAAFEQWLGQPIEVHPYNRLSGALGAALLARQERSGRRGSSAFRGFGALERVEVGSFECRACENLCQVSQISAAGGTVHFGDACERYSERDRFRAKPRGERIDLFAERRRLLDDCLPAVRRGGGRRSRAGLIRSSLNAELLPLWATFLDALGYTPVLAPASSTRVLAEHPARLPGELCLPVKAAAAQAQALLDGDEVDFVFLPSIIESPGSVGAEEYTCLYNQQLPDMMRAESEGRVVTAQFGFTEGVLGLADSALSLARALGRSVDQVLRALRAGREAQRRFDDARLRLGREVLARDFDRAVVVMGKPYNTHDPFLNLSLGRLLGRAGLLAIPSDLLPLDEIELDRRWDAVPWRYNRHQLRAVELMRRDRRLFPLLVSSFGCGPDAFTVKHLERLLGDIPRLLLEFDEHRGEAGLVTRIEAFADEIDAHISSSPRRSGPSPRSAEGSRLRPRGRRMLIPNFGPHARVFAATLRAGGWPAEVLPEIDERTVRLGEQHASGKECHPHAILIGELCRLAEREDLREGDVFFSPNADTSCLIRQYGDSFRIVRDRLGLAVEVWDCAMRDLQRLVGTPNMARLYEGLLIIDLLVTLAARLRPYVESSDSLQSSLDRAIERLCCSVERRERSAGLGGELARELWRLPRRGNPGDRPVIGVTGDIYTRIHPMGNLGLFSLLEEFGCEVWPSPFIAEMTDLSSHQRAPRDLRQGQVVRAASAALTTGVTRRLRRQLLAALPAGVRPLVEEPTPERLQQLAAPYAGRETNHLILLSVAKLVDFIERGASGAMSVAGLNCMVGTTVAASLPAIRRDHPEAPLLSLAFGGTMSPSLRIRIETFAEQVRQSRRLAGGEPHPATSARQ